MWELLFDLALPRLSASWGPIEDSPGIPPNITTLQCKSGPMIFAPLCRETPVSRTADVIFSSLLVDAFSSLLVA